MGTDVQQELYSPLVYAKSGYWLTEYLSISRVIAKSKSPMKMLIYTQKLDEKDMGYFYSLQPKSTRACF